MAGYDFDVDNNAFQNLLEPVYSFLSSALPPPIYSIVESLLHYSAAFLVALYNLVSSITSTQTWDTQKILPPLITLLMAYLALVSFYRTTGWMIRTTFWFVKWGGILAALAAGTGYFMGNQGNGGNGVGAFNGGLVSMFGNAILGMLNDNEDGARARSRSSRPRAGASGTGPRTRSKTEKEKERPKAWDNWDRHRDWQHGAGEAGRGGDGARGAEDLQEAMEKMAGYVQEALGTSWWDSVKQVVEGRGFAGTSGEAKEETQSQRKTKQDAKGRGSSR